MRTIRLRGRIPPDRTLRLELPADVPEGPAEVTITVPDGESQETASSLREFLEETQRRSRKVRTKEEIDRYLEVERSTWE